METLQGLELFVTIVESGSLTGAARKMGVPRSTVSRRLTRLESALGVALVERTTRSMQLTEAGRLFHSRGRELVRQARILTDDVGQLDHEPRGPLVMAAQMGMGRAFTADFLKRFNSCYPRVQLRALQTELHLSQLVDEVDVLIMEGPIQDTSWIGVPLSPADHLAFASPDYLEEMGVPKELADLEQHRCLAQVMGAHDSARWPLVEGGFVPVTTVFSSNDFDVVRSAAVAGLGIAVLPLTVTTTDLVAGTLLPVLTGVLGRSCKLYALFPPHRRQSPKVRALLQVIEEMVEESSDVITEKLTEPSNRNS